MIVFDFDGTLVDSDFIDDDVIVEVCNELGLVSTLDDVRPFRYVQRPRSKSIWRKLRLPQGEQRVRILREITRRIDERAASCRFFSGIPERDLRRRGKPIGIATGSTRARLEKMLAQEGLDVLIGGSIRAGEAANKPSPDMLSRLVGASGMA